MKLEKKHVFITNNIHFKVSYIFTDLVCHIPSALIVITYYEE